MSKDPVATDNWWGTFELTEKQTRQWEIGPLSLFIRCSGHEWQVAHTRNDNETNHWTIHDSDRLPEQIDNYTRYIFQQTSPQLTLIPLLADRPVIARPHVPFNLTAGEETTLYISSPLWLELAAGKSTKKMAEIPIQRPSDTWFGPSTLEGELCYASTTHCRLNLEELPQRRHRAITPVVIRNRADSTLLVERLNLPAPMLPLYASAKGQLWTPKITLIREQDGDMAALKIDSKPPSQAGDAVQLSQPREATRGSILIRAFNAVFS